MLNVHRINARRQLFRQLQQFFEEHLAGLWTISNMVFDQPDLMPKERGRRQLQREQVCGHFGHYSISVSSPEEKPPLGEVVCSSLHGFRVEGVLDARTWSEIAAAIKLDPNRGDFNVDDGRGYRPFS